MRVSFERSDWKQYDRIHERLDNAKKLGTVLDWSCQHDPVNNRVIYEVTYEPRTKEVDPGAEGASGADDPTVVG